MDTDRDGGGKRGFGPSEEGDILGSFDIVRPQIRGTTHLRRRVLNHMCRCADTIYELTVEVTNRRFY